MGYAGEMALPPSNRGSRADVRAVMPGARSVIVLGTVYNVDRPSSTEIVSASTALIARYAWGDDYHDVIERRTALVEWMRSAAPVRSSCAGMSIGARAGARVRAVRRPWMDRSQHLRD